MMAGDMSALGEIFKRMQEIERPVRDLNKTHARRIADLLPEEKRAAFNDEFKRRAFPRVYRESAAEKAIAAAEKLADLTAEQKQSIADLKAQYERDAAPINARWAEAIQDRDEKGFNPMDMFMPGGGGEKENPVAEQRKARRELDRATRKKLEGALSESQIAKLPEDKGNMQQDMMENMGMDFDFESLQAEDE
jgi:hypothetical protein